MDGSPVEAAAGSDSVEYLALGEPRIRPALCARPLRHSSSRTEDTTAGKSAASLETSPPMDRCLGTEDSPQPADTQELPVSAAVDTIQSVKELSGLDGALADLNVRWWPSPPSSTVLCRLRAPRPSLGGASCESMGILNLSQLEHLTDHSGSQDSYEAQGCGGGGVSPKDATALEAQVAQLEYNLRSQRDATSALQSQLQQAEEANQQLLKALNKAEADAAVVCAERARSSALRADCERLQTALETEQRTAAAAAERAAAADRRTDLQQREADQLRSRLAATDAAATDAAGRRRGLERALVEAGRCADLLRRDLASRDATLDTARRAEEGLRAAVREQRDSLLTLQQEKSRCDDELTAARRQLELLRSAPRHATAVNGTANESPPGMVNESIHDEIINSIGRAGDGDPTLPLSGIASLQLVRAVHASPLLRHKLTTSTPNCHLDGSLGSPVQELLSSTSCSASYDSAVETDSSAGFPKSPEMCESRVQTTETSTQTEEKETANNGKGLLICNEQKVKDTQTENVAFAGEDQCVDTEDLAVPMCDQTMQTEPANLLVDQSMVTDAQLQPSVIDCFTETEPYFKDTKEQYIQTETGNVWVCEGPMTEERITMTEPLMTVDLGCQSDVVPALDACSQTELKERLSVDVCSQTEAGNVISTLSQTQISSLFNECFNKDVSCQTDTQFQMDDGFEEGVQPDIPAADFGEPFGAPIPAEQNNNTMKSLTEHTYQNRKALEIATPQRDSSVGSGCAGRRLWRWWLAAVAVLVGAMYLLWRPARCNSGYVWSNSGGWYSWTELLSPLLTMQHLGAPPI